MTFVGSEWSHPVERALIPWLEREYGPNHRVVHRARREAEHLREEKYAEVARVMERLERNGEEGVG